MGLKLGEQVRQGMRCSGLRGARTHPLQASAIVNFQRCLRHYLFNEPVGER